MMYTKRRFDFDEPGIWICAQYPFLAGSPNPSIHECQNRLLGCDGVVYETLESQKVANGQGILFRCRRSLLEIKTPFKLRNRTHGGEFYSVVRQSNGKKNRIPSSYYDQIMGIQFVSSRRIQLHATCG